MKRKLHFQPPTIESLAKAALAYLGRFAASEMSLRRVLENRIRRACLRDDTFAQDNGAHKALRRAIDDIVEKHRKSGVLNDAAFAETKVHSLRRAGRSARAITQKLEHAGVKKEIIRDALNGNDDDSEDAEMKAARELARRRQLGSFRKGGADADRFRKDLAVLARAGFTLAVARQALTNQCEAEDGAN